MAELITKLDDKPHYDVGVSPKMHIWKVGDHCQRWDQGKKQFFDNDKWKGITYKVVGFENDHDDKNTYLAVSRVDGQMCEYDQAMISSGWGGDQWEFMGVEERTPKIDWLASIKEACGR